jgi:hypothetical protein
MNMTYMIGLPNKTQMLGFRRCATVNCGLIEEGKLEGNCPADEQVWLYCILGYL